MQFKARIHSVQNNKKILYPHFDPIHCKALILQNEKYNEAKTAFPIYYSHKKTQKTKSWNKPPSICRVGQKTAY